MTRNVHVGIVTYNSLGDLPAFFASLTVQTYPAFRVTVLDNASSDGTAEWIRQNAPFASLISNPFNAGFGSGHNEILRTRTTDEDYLALNSDMQLDPRCIEALMAVTNLPMFSWATGKLLRSSAIPARIYSVGHALERGGYAFNIGHGLVDEGQFDEAREVFGAPGAMAYYTAAFLNVMIRDDKLFDEAMFLYAEDTDSDWRARRQGLRCLYMPEAVAVHRGSQPVAELRNESLANRYLSVLKNAYPFDLLTYNIPFMIVHVVLRMVLTPRAGVQIAEKLLHNALPMLRSRQNPVLKRADMLNWFRWSRAQPTTQPRSIRQRIAAFLRTR